MKELECIICGKSENIIDYEFLGFSACEDGDCGSNRGGIIHNLDTGDFSWAFDFEGK